MASSRDFARVAGGAIRKKITPAMNRAAEQARRVAVAQIAEEVKSHPISQELITHEDPSPFLSSIGSLFGFMGFKVGRNPVGELVSFLKRPSSFRVSPATHTSLGGDGIILKASGPQDEDLANNGIVLDDWGDGRSWPEVVESGGLFGLSKFLAGNDKYGKSRSQEGIQLKKTISNVSDSLPPIPYLSPIFVRAKRRFIEVFKAKLK